jgi:hypothetical protein
MSVFSDVAHSRQHGRQACFRTTTTMNDATLLVFTLGSCALLLLARRLSTSHKAKRLPLPPGPKTSWFGGIELPRTHQWLTYAQWKDTFGLSSLL